MADYRDRSSSIFSDDDRGDRYGATTDDRGFLEKAGDEIRSWFGDDEAERRRDADARLYEREYDNDDRSSGRGSNMPGSSYGADRSYSRMRMDDRWDRGQRAPAARSAPTGGYAQDGGYRESGFGHAQPGASHHDESYRRWRDQQIAALDAEYDAFRQHRQTQFEQDFSSFRESRRSGITSGGASLDQPDTGTMSVTPEGEAAAATGTETQSRSGRS